MSKPPKKKENRAKEQRDSKSNRSMGGGKGGRQQGPRQMGGKGKEQNETVRVDRGKEGRTGGRTILIRMGNFPILLPDVVFMVVFLSGLIQGP